MKLHSSCHCGVRFEDAAAASSYDSRAVMVLRLDDTTHVGKMYTRIGDMHLWGSMGHSYMNERRWKMLLKWAKSSWPARE